MPRRHPSTSAVYKERASKLRSLGFHTAYGNGKKGSTSPAHKAAVSKRWNKIAPLFITNTKQEFKFFPLKKGSRQTLNKYSRKDIENAAIAAAQLTPGGVFLRIPKGIKAKDYKLRIGDEGEMITYSTGPRGGKRKETVYDLDPVALADDPRAAVENLLDGLPKPLQARLVVNGNEAKVPLDWKAFLEYAPEKISFILDPNLDPTGEQARIHGSAGMDEETFAEIFQVKVIHQIGAPSPTRKKEKTRHAKKKDSRRRR